MIRKGGRGNKIGHAKDQLMNVVELDLQFWMHGAVRSGKAGSTPAITPRRLPPLSLVHHTLHLSNTLAHRLCKNSIASGLVARFQITWAVCSRGIWRAITSRCRIQMRAPLWSLMQFQPGRSWDGGSPSRCASLHKTRHYHCDFMYLQEHRYANR
jgi:hypothetical protein